ncbi:MAG: protein kinase [Novosphingobium sp.]|nr:protein kinase [Novosphingobium sp.]
MTRAQVAISIGQYSTAGAKEANQDFHGSLVPENGLLASKGIAIAIADGISTSALGAAAAETAVKSFLTDYFATSEAWSVQTSAQRVISATNSWMYAQNARGYIGAPSDEERERGMVCTFSAMVFKSRSAHLFHIGDARIARIAGNSIETLTEAHRVHLGGGESYLGRAMGVNRHVEIDYRRIAVQPGDIFALTTDGVHEFLPDAAIAEAAAANDNLDSVARIIAEAALAAGSQDNLTVQLARIDTLPDGAIDDLIGDQVALPPAPRLEPGQTFEGYSILRELHSGSRSHVYLARDKADGSKVALKVPATEHAQDPAQMQALLLEEWVARRISNPHVLKAAPIRGARRHAYSVTEYVEGRTLDSWMHDNPEPDLAVVRSLVSQVAAGLQALHRREMIHRDLRPHNVIVDADGTARLIDFGSAQVAGLDDIAPRDFEDAAFAGTMQYSAPELYLGHPASRRSDIYSLGVIAYQMLTGRLPYGPRVAAANTRAAQKRLRYAPATEFNPAVPDWMDAAIAKAVSIDPAERYEELSEFTFDLAHPNPSLVTPDPRPLLQRKPERLWQAISAVLFVLLMLTLWRGG